MRQKLVVYTLSFAFFAFNLVLVFGEYPPGC